MPFTNHLFTTDKTPIESHGGDKLSSAVFLCTSAPKLITCARTHAHMRASVYTHTYTHTQTQYLLWVVTDWVNITINAPIYNVSIQNGGLREKQVLSQTVGRGRHCNSLLLLLDHWESSTGFLHNLSPLWHQRNWRTLPFHIYPFLSKPPPRFIPKPSTFTSVIWKALPHFFPPLYSFRECFAITFFTFTHLHPASIQ